MTSGAGANAPPNPGFVVLQVHGAVAIPVGHRVEIRVYYSFGETGLFSVDPPAPQFDSPLITDLETGIQYGKLRHFCDASLYSEFAPAQATPLPYLREHSRWRGKILVCNVLFCGGQYDQLQTTLLIEPMPAETGPYR
ncbi:MAG: hypothetical protein FWD73_06555 [Polyangiaceae bacterium]|nr:hypothetical protein [Polyangiaceae bacterium]